MKSRGSKSGKAGKKRGATDVAPSTSLPPLVEGQLRCILRVTVSKILWTTPRPQRSVHVRLRWWGETTNGTIFHPRDSSQTDQKEVKTTTRYAVHCGPKQLTSYLTDMGALVLEVLTRLDHLAIGRAQISDISRLSPTHPLSGFFTIVSPTSEKLGELQVSVALEPLCEKNGDSGSILNSDVSHETAPSGHRLQPSKLSAGRTGPESSRAATPRGRDHLYFKENAEPNRGLVTGSEDPLSDDGYRSQRLPSKDKTSVIPFTQERSADQTKGYSNVTTGPAAKDLLTALLDQGSKLRDAMVESALRLDPQTDIDVESERPPVPVRDHYSSRALRAAPETLPMTIDHNLLNAHKSLTSNGRILPPADHTLPELELNSDTRAIELLLGSSPVSIRHFWDGTGSPPESIADSDFYNESELGDPLYDQSLLENLFYKAPKLEDSSSDVVSDDDLSKSRRKRTKTVKSEKADERKSAPCDAEKELSSRSPERPSKTGTRSEAVDLSVDRLAHLGRMHAARVIVQSLKIQRESDQVTSSKLSRKGKPPRPAPAIKRTFFVEFHFPVSSKDKDGELPVATEVTRLVSNKITNGAVKFQQRFVFPILFHGLMIQHWWNSGLTFRIYMRKSTEKKPGLLGSAILSLRDVLRSQDLSVSQTLPVRCLENQQQLEDVGPLKVSVAVAGDSREFSNIPEKASLRVQDASASFCRPNVSVMAPEDQSYTEGSPEEPVEPMPSVLPAKQHVHHQTERPKAPESEEENGLLLHAILMVPEGKGLVCDPEYSSICNPYLNCKLFSSQEATRSAVAWGSNQPLFSFSQVAPVSLTSRLLERMENNVMILEVWNKVPDPTTDQLLGLVKLPLHQFYMSFSDPKICRLLLQAQYPVVAVDSFVPIVDMFSGCERGRLKVLLAMGSGDQVVALQRLKNEEGTSAAQIPRPAHFLDPPQSSVEVSRPSDSSTDHVFEIHVENVKGLTPLQSTVWGEADCYVQYFFPAHSTISSLGSELPEQDLSLKPVRTATTLCVPDPVFNDRQNHSLVAPSDTPVQRLLLNAFSMQGLSAGGGMTFEIWCRYYYPNVRDQIVARAILPLSRLCAMVTMHHREELGIQAFCLPLTPISESSAGAPPPSSGLLNVNVTYRRSVRNPVGMLATRMASVSVQIHRASGLQAAARVVAQQDPSFQYSADVGVNAFIIIRPSFLPEAEVRNTRTIARSFCPEFDYHSEFPCNLVTQRSSGEACSLAEILHSSEIVFSIHHQSVTPVLSTASGSRVHPARDHQLGVVRIPTRELLTKRSGISGWYPVMVPEDSTLSGTAGVLDNVVGGLELSVSFAHHSDRERVLEVARGLGWTEGEDGDGNHSGHDELVNLSVTVPKIWLPVHCLLMAGHKHLHKSTHCYLRYKLYDKEAVRSPLTRPILSKDGQQATVVYEQTRTVELMKHQPLVWYLREEKLEIQIWRSYGKDTSGPRPQDTDRLLGCAYVDLAVLSENTSRTLSVSGVYPLFKHKVANLWGAALRVHLCLSSAYHPSIARCPNSPEEESLSEDYEAQDVSEDYAEGKREDPIQSSKKAQIDKSSQSPGSEATSAELENTFAVNIVVERAMHLSLKGSPLTERAVPVPSCSVSFPVAGTATPVTTPIVDSTDSPTWNFQLQTRLSEELLLDPQQTLVFKVWHKADVERVLGFASVDLSPLLTGFQSVCGWYNIGDFTGQCQGQIKVSVTPLENISHLKEQKRLRNEASPRPPEVLLPPSSLCPPGPALLGSFPTSPLPQRADLAHVPPGAGNRETIFPTTRHEERTETIRRFQEPVQQAEQNTWSAEHMDALSQSSRAPLLSALRRNLGELDDIQKYFNQKLYRSLSNTEPAEGASLQNVEPKPPSSEDTETRLLLTKSSLLVSQVSDLLSGLQGRHVFREPPTISRSDATSHSQHVDTGAQEPSPAPCAESNQMTGHQEQSDDESDHPRADTPPFSAAGSPTRRENDLENFFHPPLREDDYHASSDEEYEENVIEPRTLNEISTLTDRTSPWSSMDSDTEPDFIEHKPRKDETSPADSQNGEDPTENPPLLSQVLFKVDQSNTLTSDGSSESQSPDEDLRAPSCAQNDIEAQDAETGHTILTSNHCEEEESGEAQETSAELETDDPHLHHEESEDETRSQGDSTHPDMSEEEATGPVEGTSGHLLSDPVLLPNFFLPPEHLEASMRFLSLSPALPSAQKDGDDTAVSRGIPFRRRPRQLPRMSSGELPEAEVNRIARIFAAQFSNKK
ncbi:C2 domain-containing protein 3 isoform X2 [Bufo bufo]|uniref:C2 domain-containing protein 3 isoform X2 n=1 Tax=Bufo bufo TaxID=8384 RepID=UPI001ABDE6F8|nr:C2 domain-containing protein 3 isoform X2 [Bufo bufo]